MRYDVMIRYRDGINVLDELKKCGFTTYELRKQKIIGESRIQKLREGDLPTWKELNFICSITSIKVGAIIEYVRDKEDDSW